MTELYKLTETYTPTQAMVLYSGNGKKYLEVVDIKEGVMCNPTPASLELVGKMIAGVQYESQTKTIHWKGLIPSWLHKLHCTPNRLEVLFSYEEEKQMMHFKNEMFPSGIYYIPKLLFHIINGSVHVYAKGNKNKNGTTLYRAPFLNVSDSGSTCMGSASLDDWKDFENVNEYLVHAMDKFWNSEFSEIHGEPVLGGDYGRFLKYRKECTPLIKEMKKLDKTLEDLL